VSADIVNLRRARKAKARNEAEAAAAERRAAFGKSKVARAADDENKTLAERRFEGHRLEPRGGSGNVDER
jgi:hypothetical protein